MLSNDARLCRFVIMVCVAWCLWPPAAPARAQFCPDAGIPYPTSDAPLGDVPTRVRTCDIDQDNDVDLLTANDGSRTVSVLINHGSGQFAAPIRVFTGPDPGAEPAEEPVDVACCDVDGDRHIDLIAANRAADHVAVMFNDGNLQFSAPVTFPVGTAPWGIACLELDGINGPDIVTANFTTDDVSVLLNNGQGAFAAQPPTSVGNAPFAITTCDVDDDQDLDVMTSDFADSTVSVARNNGNGTLTLIDSFDVGEIPFDVTCCDLDGMNGPDIVTANGLGDSVSILFNSGSGAFSSPTIEPSSDNATGVACCDLDRDGVSDIAVAGSGDGDLGILLNGGSGSFSSPPALAVGSNAFKVTCASFDADAVSDLAVTFDDGVNVFLNGDCCEGGLDCDDGLFCTGTETCDGETCISSGNPCANQGLPCDEAGDTCGDAPACPGGSTAECADLDGDAVRDQGCIWWACVAQQCQAIIVPYSDLGGANGACTPDGTADGNDRFHALNCFSNQTTTGLSGYPCADNPPTAFNVDAAGLGAPCVPDGVCDGNDAFAALNAFSGTTTCSCPNPLPWIPSPSDTGQRVSERQPRRSRG